MIITNPAITSREAILEVSRSLLMEKGSSFNIRTVASAGGISVGSIYNYFPSKSELVAATVESIWRDIFPPPHQEALRHDFLANIEWLYERMAWGGEKYPGFFALHAVSFFGEEKNLGKKYMERSWKSIQDGLTTVLENDRRIRGNAFDAALSREAFVRFIFSALLSALLQQDYRCSALLEIVKRTIY